MAAEFAGSSYAHISETSFLSLNDNIRLGNGKKQNAGPTFIHKIFQHGLRVSSCDLRSGVDHTLYNCKQVYTRSVIIRTFGKSCSFEQFNWDWKAVLPVPIDSCVQIICTLYMNPSSKYYRISKYCQSDNKTLGQLILPQLYHQRISSALLQSLS